MTQTGVTEAMMPREPTDAMIEAAAATPGMKACNDAMVLHQCRGYGFGGKPFEDGSPLHQAWRAMFDTALAMTTAAPEKGIVTDPERFLTAYVSQDGKVIGIEHDTEADWHEIQRAHEVLRDRLNVRLAERDKCPFKPALEAARKQA